MPTKTTTVSSTVAAGFTSEPSIKTMRDEIDGFDPLGLNQDDASMSQVFEEANRRTVYNILKNYTGYYDVFSELIQNSLDAVQTRQRLQEKNYDPHIWITIDIPNSLIRIVDNGVGMSHEEFKYCLRPSVSFKRQAELRGHKGVGATFLAYGFSLMKLQTKKSGHSIAAILRQGRQWAEDKSGTVPKPKLEATDFDVPELMHESSGTCCEIIVGQSAGERPKDLGWFGAQLADQWLNVLRMKTPLGGVYLNTPPFSPKITVTVKANERTEPTTETVTRAEYYYPHEIPGLKTQSLSDIQKAIKKITGDPGTVFTRLGNEYKRLDCVYDIWSKDDILSDESQFASALDDADKILIERHNVCVYACFLHTAKLWGQLNDDILKLRKGQKIIQGGLQIASDYMPQGDLSIIPLTRAIGYQANSHVVVHFLDGDPDTGRKVFQPELKKLAENLAVRSVNTMTKYLQHMKRDTGEITMAPDRELHEWIKKQESYRERNPLSLIHNGNAIALVSQPQQEQDVIALFHEMIGLGILQGYKFFATSQSDRYDSLFFMEYVAAKAVQFDADNLKLGVTRSYPTLPYTTEPKILEYKYTFESLVSDIEKEEKFAKHIDLVVCWRAGSNFKERYYLQSLLVGDEGSNREFFGATHKAVPTGSQEPAFELIVLEDLLNWLQDPAGEEARHKLAYRD